MKVGEACVTGGLPSPKFMVYELMVPQAPAGSCDALASKVTASGGAPDIGLADSVAIGWAVLQAVFPARV
jgi:hypothetical protein